MPISGRAMRAKPGEGIQRQDNSRVAARTVDKAVFIPVRVPFISVTSQNLHVEIIEGDGDRIAAACVEVPRSDKAYLFSAARIGIQNEILVRGSNGAVVIQKVERVKSRTGSCVFHPRHGVVRSRGRAAGLREIIVGRDVVVPRGDRASAQTELVGGPSR